MLRVGSKVCNHIKNSILLSEVHEMLTEAGLREGTSDRRGGSWWQLRIVFRAGESTWKWGGHSERHVQVSCEGRQTKAKRCRGLDRGCVWTVGLLPLWLFFPVLQPPPYWSRFPLGIPELRTSFGHHGHPGPAPSPREGQLPPPLYSPRGS